ncbi:MAG: hypothetical protein J6J42_08065 [Lachnospiraceae bacterium]|nr:hypothetical protein [Lachnospiraceae bacterium]
MKKKIITLAVVAFFAVALTACGAAQTSNTPAPTVEPTKEVEATTAPTVEPTKEAEVTVAPTVEPTATNAPEPTATSTPTPEPTAIPVPTEAPKAETNDWKTVLRELHSLTTYKEREAYVAGLDASLYKVGQTESFDIINKCNSAEVEVELMNEGEVVIGYIGYSKETYDEIGEYAVDELPEEYREAIRDIYSDNEYQPVEVEGYGLCYFETVYGYPTKTQTAYADLEGLLSYNWEPFGETAYLMTITNVTTGETDPWGVCYGRMATIEEAIAVYESSYVGEWGPAMVNFYKEAHGYKPAHIETWDTLKYYEDLVSLK